MTRAAIALVPGIAIAFIPDHSAAFGLLVFGLWATVSGVVVGALVLRGLSGLYRGLFLTNALLTAVVGLLALSLTDAGLAFYLFLVSVWAAVTGFLELYAGVRQRNAANRAGERSTEARDRITVGALTAVFALVYLLLPPNAVVAVGILGAYLVIIGVFLAIAGFSLRWDAPRASVTTPNEEVS
ncbi:DUF308 domain-containing protein [Rathayibacter sp. YIM 133350]|uniref:DUF308 domain-containing protein n=1 Tax=Rathayibacter sp. YIM 133350 TaxID=3131992 RepID=UPI00307DA618